MTRLARLVLGIAAGATAATGVASEGAGQSLHLAELFAEQGRVDDARAEVLAWFEIREDEASPDELQHGLWLRARLAEDPVVGRADLEAFVGEYPQGAYTPHALAWLAAAADTEGNERRAVTLYRRVLDDHPESLVAPDARAWLRSRGVAVEEPTPPARRVAPARRPDPVSTRDSLASAARADSLARADSVAQADSAAQAFERFVANVDTSAKLSMPAREPVRADSAAADVSPATSSSADTSVATPRRPAVADSALAPPEADPPTSAPEVVDSIANEVTEVVDSASALPSEATPPPAEVAAADPPAADPPAQETTPAADPEPEPEFESVPPGPPVPGAASAGSFAVQIGAFRNPVGAGGLVDELITAGFDARLVQVPINDLLRVRIGRYATLEEAQAELARVQAGGYDGAVVSDARRETQVR